jgi:hypothetical protein
LPWFTEIHPQGNSIGIRGEAWWFSILEATSVPCVLKSRLCRDSSYSLRLLGLPPNFIQQLDLHRTFASEITHDSWGAGLRQMMANIYTSFHFSLQSGREEGDRGFRREGT